MSNHQSAPWGDAVVCAMCGWRLLPLSLTRASMDDEAMGIANRPDLKCSSCGQCYQWQDSCGWVPTGNSECAASSDVYELAGYAVEGHGRRVRSAPRSGPVLGHPEAPGTLTLMSEVTLKPLKLTLPKVETPKVQRPSVPSVAAPATRLRTRAKPPG
jgi:hypothetical protein